MRKTEKGKDCMRKKQKRFLVIMMLACMLFSLTACKKKTSETEGQATGTPALIKGNEFADANPELVAAQAKKNKETVAVTVGDMEISMEKAMLLIYTMEVQGNSYADYYEAQYGMDYWEMVYDEEGHTVREVFKEDTMETIIQYAILNACAVENGIGLTDAELQENNALVEEMKKLLTAEETERGGFTTENLRETSAWMMLAEKYYKQMTDNLGITRESIRETVNKDDYKEYDTEYLYLSTTYYDEEYNVCQESDDVKNEKKASMQEYYEQVEDGVLFEKLAAVDESLVHNRRTFMAEGQQAEPEYMEAAMKLAEGEVCGPVQTEYGVYLIRMIDTECTKTYEATVEEKYELKCSEAFLAAYEVLKEEYEVKVNEEAWGDITLGATVSILE